MFIGAGSFAELAPFIQVTLWIGLPLAAIVGLITIFWHYRQKRGKLLQPVVEGKHAFLLPIPGMQPQAQQYLFVDHSGLVRRQQRQLSLGAARYAVLKRDFQTLQEKYTALITSQNILSMQHEHADNLMEATEPVFTDESLAAMDRDMLLQKLNELNNAFQTLEREHAVLLARAGLTENANVPENEEEWRQERVQLLTRLAEHAYLSDLLDEKTLQLRFLQQQLEERIRRYHQATQLQEQAVAELGELRLQQTQLEERVSRLSEEKDRRIAESQLWQDERNRLEASRQTMLEGYEQQQRQLQSELEQLRIRYADAEQQLLFTRQLIQDIGRLAGSLHDSPVVAMQAVP